MGRVGYLPRQVTMNEVASIAQNGPARATLLLEGPALRDGGPGDGGAVAQREGRHVGQTNAPGPLQGRGDRVHPPPAGPCPSSGTRPSRTWPRTKVAFRCSWPSPATTRFGPCG